VPDGNEYDDRTSALSAFPYFQNRAIVVKPKSTNFGLGITILKENSDESLYQKAIDMAFQHDSTVLVESFVSGKEYRIFLINQEVVGILHRVPANVTGDGTSTIRELVQKKNTDALRGKGYRKPLEKIALGAEETMFLEMQGLSFDSVPADQETIYATNRFVIYAMYPDCNISIHKMWGLKKQNVVFAIGKSITNRSSKTNVGELCLKYGGGGHMNAGTCQVETSKAETVLGELIETITSDG